MTQTHVSVIGTTSWGTTLAIIMARRGLEVELLARSSEEAEQIDSQRTSPRFPGTIFPSQLRVSSDWDASLAQASMVVFAVPSSTLRENARCARLALSNDAIVICATKGLEQSTAKRMSVLLQEEIPTVGGRIGVLSGPNLAKEVLEGLPTSTVVASSDERVMLRGQELLNSDTFRVYTNDDVIGVELAGALKNVIAIGAGIIDGITLGSNAKASFLTRSLAEITRLGVACGARPMTFMGSAGLGDLLATAFSGLSRNYRIGASLAKGASLEQAVDGLGGQVAEGISTAAAALRIADQLHVDMPITAVTYSVLFENWTVREALAMLMSREPTREAE